MRAMGGLPTARHWLMVEVPRIHGVRGWHPCVGRRPSAGGGPCTDEIRYNAEGAWNRMRSETGQWPSRRNKRIRLWLRARHISGIAANASRRRTAGPSSRNAEPRANCSCSTPTITISPWGRVRCGTRLNSRSRTAGPLTARPTL